MGNFRSRLPLAKQHHLPSIDVKYCLRSHFICRSYGNGTPVQVSWYELHLPTGVLNLQDARVDLDDVDSGHVAYGMDGAGEGSLQDNKVLGPTVGGSVTSFRLGLRLLGVGALRVGLSQMPLGREGLCGFVSLMGFLN